MVSLINKQLLLTAYAYLFIMEQQEAQQGSQALQLQLESVAKQSLMTFIAEKASAVMNKTVIAPEVLTKIFACIQKDDRHSELEDLFRKNKAKLLEEVMRLSKVVKLVDDAVMKVLTEALALIVLALGGSDKVEAFCPTTHAELQRKVTQLVLDADLLKVPLPEQFREFKDLVMYAIDHLVKPMLENPVSQQKISFLEMQGRGDSQETIQENQKTAVLTDFLMKLRARLPKGGSGLPNGILEGLRKVLNKDTIQSWWKRLQERIRLLRSNMWDRRWAILGTVGGVAIWILGVIQAIVLCTLPGFGPPAAIFFGLIWFGVGCLVIYEAWK